MRKDILIGVVGLLAIIGGAFLLFQKRSEQMSCSSGAGCITNEVLYQKVGDSVDMLFPVGQDTVKSPLEIRGRARGTWFFEASFPVVLKDANGAVLASGTAEAQGDWMTEDYVPFKAVLTFSKPRTIEGTLVIKKDNPSGLPEHDSSVEIPVRFE